MLLLSDLFAAPSAIFAKLGAASVNSNHATGTRTVGILIMILYFVLARSEAKGISTMSKQNIISGVTTGLSVAHLAAHQGNETALVLLQD